MRGFGRLAGGVLAVALALSAEGVTAAGKDPHAKAAKVEQTDSAKPLNPALFKIVNAQSTMYILGSIHLLPVGFSWHTPALDQAINGADYFVFETNLDNARAELHFFMDHQGYLPRGQMLHKMLSPEAVKKYAALIAANSIDRDRVDYLRPGVAVFLLDSALTRAHSSVPLGPGVDDALVNYAKRHGKLSAFLETPQTQFEALAALGGGSDVAVLEKRLMTPRRDSNEYQAVLAAWSKGDLAKLGSLQSDEMDPKEGAILLDNRNKAWFPELEDMLKIQGTYLVTVGALHLTGPNSVIGLLCAHHWKVQRVQTGGTAPPPACPESYGAR
jgi:uncharacterized protein